MRSSTFLPFILASAGAVSNPNIERPQLCPQSLQPQIDLLSDAEIAAMSAKDNTPLPGQVDRKIKYTISRCTDSNMMSKLKASIPEVSAMAKKAAAHALNGENRELFTKWFRTDDDDTRKKVSYRFLAMEKDMNDNNGPTSFSCNGLFCNGALAYCFPATGAISMCAPSARGSVKVTKCENGAFPGVMIHELSHSAVLFEPGTDDILDCAAGGCKKLSAAQALNNADTYNMYAQSVWLNQVCYG